MSAQKNLIKFPEKTNLIKLDQYDLIKIKGIDAREFLNNQFTNDLKTLAENESSLGAWCSIKGRVLYTFRIWFDNETFWLLLPTVQTESFLKKLNMYIFRSDVMIDQVNNKFIYGLSGKDADQFLNNVPKNDNTFINNEEDFVIKIPAPIPRYLIISEKDDLETGSVNNWKLLDIMAGIPEILPDTADKFLPQMLDLENLGGLSFQKGCYPGQEIVARVKYRGELKQQLYKAQVNSSNPIETGAILVTESDEKMLAGHVVNAVQLDENNWALLAVINIAVAQDDKIKLKEDNSANLQLEID
jgi:folate-binding protein YgfZ